VQRLDVDLAGVERLGQAASGVGRGEDDRDEDDDGRDRGNNYDGPPQRLRSGPGLGETVNDDGPRRPLAATTDTPIGTTRLRKSRTPSTWTFETLPASGIDRGALAADEVGAADVVVVRVDRVDDLAGGVGKAVVGL
jgi:hypothetical protein